MPNIHGTKTTLAFLPADQEASFIATSKFGLLTIRQHSAARKPLILYPQGDRSGLRNPKNDKNQH